VPLATSRSGSRFHNAYQHYLKLGMYRHPAIATDNRLDIREVSIQKLKEWPFQEELPAATIKLKSAKGFVVYHHATGYPCS
jgi:hypothetical protein